MTTTAIESIIDQPGRTADGRTTMQQIGTGVLMSCGARNFASDDENGLFMFQVGPGRTVIRKVLVRLMRNDTYTVEFGRTTMNPRSPKFGEWEVVEQETGIYAAQLPEVVRRLGDRETY